MRHFLFLAFLIPVALLAQTPSSITQNISLQNEIISLDAPQNIQELALQESFSGESFKFAKFVASDITINNSGNWTNAQNGKIWSVDIKSDDAKNLSLLKK